MLPRPLPLASVVWVGVIGGPALLDWWADQGEPDGDTCSELIRRTFRTDTAAGRAAFTTALAVGSGWLHSHILKEIG